MTYLPSHILIQTLGFAVLCLVLLAGHRWLRKSPIAAYRLFIAVALLAILAPLVQWTVQGRLTSDRGRSAELEMVGPVPLHESGRAVPAESLKPVDQDRTVQPGTSEVLQMAAEIDRESSRGIQAPPLLTRANNEAGGNTGLGRTLVAIYLLGAAVFLLRGLILWCRTMKVISSAKPIADQAILDLWEKVADDSVLRDARLLETPMVHSPSCWRGLRHAYVLLPVEQSLGEHEDLMACVLRHEFIHLRRRDSWIAHLQVVLASLLWFHPGAWWLSRQISLYRELSCDEWTVAWAGRERYAHALIDFADHLQQCAESTAARHSLSLVPLSPSKSLLRRRIEMLISNKKPASRSLRTMTMAVTLLAVGMIWTGQAVAAAWWLPADQEEQRGEQDEGRASLGITVQKVGPSLASQLGVPQDRLVAVETVDGKAPAGRAGLEAGDVIIGVGGSRGLTVDELREAVRKKTDGVLQLQILRRLKRMTIDIPLGKNSESRKSQELVRTLARKAIEAYLDDDLGTCLKLSQRALVLDPENRRIQRLIELSRIAQSVWPEFKDVDEFLNSASGASGKSSKVQGEELIRDLTMPIVDEWLNVAQRSPNQRLSHELSDKKLTFEWNNIGGLEALKSVSKAGNISIVLDPEVSSALQAKVMDVQLSKASVLDAMNALVGTQFTFEILGEGRVLSVKPKSKELSAAPVLQVYEVRDIEAVLGSNKKLLKTLITDNIAPRAWSLESHAIESKKGHLIIKASPQVHEKVGRFLHDLRRFTIKMNKKDLLDPETGRRADPISNGDKQRTRDYVEFLLRYSPGNKDLQRVLDELDSSIEKTERGQ